MAKLSSRLAGGLARARRLLFYVLAVIGGITVAAVVLFFGAAFGVLWALSSGGARATVSLPSNRGAEPLVLDIQSARVGQELQKQALAGQVNTTLEVYAWPLGFRVLSVNLAAQIPLASLLSGGLPGGLPGVPSPAPGAPPATRAGAQAFSAPDLLFGPLANKTLQDALASVPSSELTSLLGGAYQAILPGLYDGNQGMTLGQVFARDPKGFLQRVKQFVPRTQLEATVQRSLQPLASMSVSDIQAMLPPDQLRAILGNDYKAFMDRMSGGDPRKTMASAIADDPTKLLDLLQRLDSAAQRGVLPTR
ncbi:MAG: hypothetical protein Q7K03_09600 [Dehalococcoidia bacterium]|nr:hypothetical protein [Dehalococcoidia bacterium]